MDSTGEVRQQLLNTTWLSTSILHDVRNPASAICAAAEILVHMERLPAAVKRLATNIYGVAAMCELREIIAAVLEAASEALGNKGVQLD